MGGRDWGLREGRFVFLVVFGDRDVGVEVGPVVRTMLLDVGDAVVDGARDLVDDCAGVSKRSCEIVM